MQKLLEKFSKTVTAKYTRVTIVKLNKSRSHKRFFAWTNDAFEKISHHLRKAKIVHVAALP